MKLILPHKVELHVPVWLKGTPESWCMSSRPLMPLGKSLQTTLEKAIKDQEECTKKLTKANEAFGNYEGKDKNPPKRRQLKK